MAWTRIERFDDEAEHVAKLVFTAADAVAEAVLYRYPTYRERTVICCSTMSGCPVGCRFCGSGDNFVRNLSGDEIVAQVEACLAATETEPSEIAKLQIMFMSMGEPLLNMKGLEGALRALAAAHPNADLLVSTSAPRVDYAPLRALAAELPKIGLQFSVHESTDEARNHLIPFQAKLDLVGIAKEGAAFLRSTGRAPFFNYCAHEGNASEEDAVRLAGLFPPSIWKATVSVICERTESASDAARKEIAAEFASRLVSRGYDVRVFDPAGQDTIGGGCGQLWFVQEWMAANPDLAKPSAGKLRKGAAA